VGLKISAEFRKLERVSAGKERSGGASRRDIDGLLFFKSLDEPDYKFATSL
jgi:hypothetical protein